MWFGRNRNVPTVEFEAPSVDVPLAPHSPALERFRVANLIEVSRLPEVGPSVASLAIREALQICTDHSFSFQETAALLGDGAMDVASPELREVMQSSTDKGWAFQVDAVPGPAQREVA